MTLNLHRYVCWHDLLTKTCSNGGDNTERRASWIKLVRVNASRRERFFFFFGSAERDALRCNAVAVGIGVIIGSGALNIDSDCVNI